MAISLATLPDIPPNETKISHRWWELSFDWNERVLIMGN
jgi:hypothetical protein